MISLPHVFTNRDCASPRVSCFCSSCFHHRLPGSNRVLGPRCIASSQSPRSRTCTSPGMVRVANRMMCMLHYLPRSAPSHAFHLACLLSSRRSFPNPTPHSTTLHFRPPTRVPTRVLAPPSPAFSRFLSSSFIFQPCIVTLSIIGVCSPTCCTDSLARKSITLSTSSLLTLAFQARHPSLGDGGLSLTRLIINL